MQTPEQFPLEERDEPYYEPDEEVFVRPGTGIWSIGGRLAWVAALVLALSSFTDWYAGSSTAGPTLAVIGRPTGVPGKLVFFLARGRSIRAGGARAHRPRGRR